MIIKIGIWEIDEFGITGRPNLGEEYPIMKDSLWQKRNYDGILVWNWPIHLTEKGWITKESIHEFNSAFFFALDYFKDCKPEGFEDASLYQTILVQQQFMDLRG